MSFAAPWLLAAAAAAAAAAVALHFLSPRRPEPELLATTRFLPEHSLRATAIRRRFRDPALLALRVLALLALGAGLAGPSWGGPREPLARIAAVDISRAVADPRGLADSALAWAGGADAVVLFNERSRVVGDGWRDSLAAFAAGGAVGGAGRGRERGSLSAALITSLRAASKLRAEAEAVELVLVSPFAREEADEATLRIRELWPGAIRAVTAGRGGGGDGPAGGPGDGTGGGSGGGSEGGVGDGSGEGGADASEGAAGGGSEDGDGEGMEGAAGERSEEDDGGLGGRAAGSRGAVLEWADSAASELWEPREPVDTVGGVGSGEASFVFPMERAWRAAEPADELPSAEAPLVRARWIDGEPAVLELPRDEGCLRSISIPIPSEGDAALRPDFRRLLATLEAPCGSPRDARPLPDEFMARLSGGEGPAPSSEIAPPLALAAPLAPWLVALALALSIVELRLRRLPAGEDAGMGEASER